MSTITTEQQQAISRLVSEMTLSSGLGDEENACSIGAINLALIGELTDNIPSCMSVAIGSWIIVVQDAMPSQMRNSAEWKRLLPLAAGTGRERERERIAIFMEWMWSDVLPTLQPLADRYGFGEEWRTMLERKSGDAAAFADKAATAAAHATSANVEAVTYAAEAATAAGIADRAAATNDKAYYAAAAARKSTSAIAAAAAGFCAAEVTAAWQQFNPCGLLQRLIDA